MKTKTSDIWTLISTTNHSTKIKRMHPDPKVLRCAVCVWECKLEFKEEKQKNICTLFCFSHTKSADFFSLLWTKNWRAIIAAYTTSWIHEKNIFLLWLNYQYNLWSMTSKINLQHRGAKKGKTLQILWEAILRWKGTMNLALQMVSHKVCIVFSSILN